MGKKGFNLEEPDKPTVAASADVELQAYSEQDGAEVITKPEKAPAKSKVGIGGLFRFASFGEKVGVALGLFFGFFQAGLIQLVPVIIGDTINKYVDIITAGSNYTNGTSTEAPVDNTDSIVGLALDIAVIMGVLIVFSFLSGTAHIGLFSAIGERQARKIRSLAFENVLRQDIGFFDKHMGGELNTRLAEDTVRYQNGVSDKMSFTHHWVWMFIWGITYCFIRSWQLTLIMLAMVPVAAFISGAVNILIKRISQREADAFAEAGAVAEEALGSVRIVAAFAGENKEAARYNECLIKARKVGIKGAVVGALSQAISYMIILIFTAVLIWYAGVLVADGEIQPGTIAQIVQCMVSGFRSLAWAVATLETISDAQGAAYGIYELIDHKTAIDPMDDTQGIKLDDIKGQVTFDNVHFCYPARADVQVLKGLSLAIQPGQTVALVGPSGCGKSTTIQLLQRYYNQQDGRVCVDGHDVRDLNVRWFRQQMGVVSQDPILFATTVEENIRFGRESATSAEIQACAKEANAHEFIMKLPDGYMTVLNEQSTQLSRGEKQRLSLARALVRKPKILLLDECTSALDNESEVIVQRALEKASKGRTTILIAHRLSTVRDSDNLFVIDKGVVAEYGTHTELLAKQKLYHSLVSTQMSEAKEKDGLARQLEEEEMSKARTASFRGRTRARSNSWGSNPDTPIELTEQDSDEVTTTVSYRELLSLNQAEMPYLIGGCIGGVIMGGCWPAFAVIYGFVLEAFTYVDDPDYIREQVNRYALVLVMIGLGAGLVSFITTFLLRYAAEYLGQRIRHKAFSAMLNQEIGWFDRRSNQVGSLTTRLANDASRVKMATGAPLASLCNALSAVVCTIVVSVLSGWQFGLVMLALMPLQTVAGLLQSYTTNTFALKAASAVEESGKIASEAVDKIRIVASLTKEDFFLQRYTNLYKNLKKEGQRRSLIIGLSWGGFHLVTGSILLAALGLGFFFVAEKIITFNAIFTILFCVLMCSLEVGRANAYIPEITTAQASAAKLFHIFNRESQINPHDPSGSIPTDFKGEIELSNIQFFYPTRQDRQVLTNFNLTVHRGQSIAMVGPTGGGKSSVVQLLERFYDASSGKVALDNSDVTSLNTEWLRKQMAIVTQDPLLFSYSIGRNIAYGDTSREVTMAEVIEAAKQANIHNFISSLPLGYDTTVGSKGTQLSGGQKQRVSIARALVRNPKILLLDDATSALDTQSEAVVEQALNNARAGRTCIVISHRLSSIINADLILYVEDGKITEQGTHAQLMAKEDRYYRLQKANLGK